MSHADADADDDEPEDDEVITCWCGATGTYEELFAEPDDEGCGGVGTIQCQCGGDLCVCHHHGEYECPGCDDCRRESDFGDDDDLDYEHDEDEDDDEYEDDDE